MRESLSTSRGEKWENESAKSDASKVLFPDIGKISNQTWMEQHNLCDPCVQDYAEKLKIVQEQWLQLNMKFLLCNNSNNMKFGI